MNRVEDYLDRFDDPRKKALQWFHEVNLPLMLRAKGSKCKHQAWEGGYIDHIGECLRMVETMYSAFTPRYCMPFPIESAIIVLYFHDIEKIWKYTDGLPEGFDKDLYYTGQLPQFGITFDPEELNALKYIHGEGDDYDPHVNVMNGLAAFCHGIDCMSARLFPEEGRGEGSREQS